MTRLTLKRAWLEERATRRPPGYLEDMLAAAVAQSADAVTFDTDGEAWRALQAKYLGVPLASAKSRGLGDTIAKITKAVGIKPCNGCRKRQEALNKAVPYRPAD